MSKNFELLRQARKNPTLAAPTPAEPRLAPWGVSPGRPPIAPDHAPDWLHALERAKRYWCLALSFAAAVVLAVTAATLLMKPVYEPVAKVEIDPPGAEAFSLESGASGVNEDEHLETNVQNLQSDRLILTVIRTLHLDENSELAGESKPQDVQQKANGIQDVSRLTVAENAALKNFRSHLQVRREAGSRLVSISFASHDPELAARVVNTLLQFFIEMSYKTRLESIQQSTEWLARQLDDVHRKMEDSNRALGEFQRTTGIADIDDNKNTFSEQLAELNRQRTIAQTERIQLGSVLNNVKSDGPDMLPQAQTNEVIQHLSQKLAETRAELSQSQVIYGKNHPNVKKLQSQADELEAQLKRQRVSIMGGLQTSYSATRSREREIGKEMKKTTKELSQMAQYSALKKEAQANAELYNALFRRIKEAGISAGSRSSGVRIMDRARVLDQPTRPHRILNIAIALIVGFVGGVGLAFIKGNMDNRIHCPEDITGLGEAPAISIMPVIGASNRTRNGMASLGLVRGFRSRPAGSLPEKFLLERPRSPESEALRALHTSIMLSRMERPPQLLLVTSSFPGEGKTTLAVNLALALAQNRPTCLVEADLRKAGVSGIFGLQCIHGLVDVLSGSAVLERVLMEVPDTPNLTVLPARAAPSQPELVCSEMMRDVLRSLRQLFTYVVIDSPPILPYADGRALSTLVDAVVFVGRSGVTTREAMQRSMTLLSDIHSAPILEIVLNATESISPEYQYYES